VSDRFAPIIGPAAVGLRSPTLSATALAPT